MKWPWLWWFGDGSGAEPFTALNPNVCRLPTQSPVLALPPVSPTLTLEDQSPVLTLPPQGR